MGLIVGRATSGACATSSVAGWASVVVLCNASGRWQRIWGREESWARGGDGGKEERASKYLPMGRGRASQWAVSASVGYR